MSEHTYTTKAKYYICDACGRKLMKSEEGESVSITIRNGPDIAFEWWSKGDYCMSCRDALCHAICHEVPTPERYDRAFRDDDTAKSVELALIKRELGIEADE